MTWIIIGLAALATIFLLLSLIKKVVKLAITAVALLLLVAGIWYLSQQAEVPEPVREAGQEAVEKLKQGAGQAVDRAAEAIKDHAGETMDRAVEVVREEASKALEEATKATEEDAPKGDDEGAESEAAGVESGGR